MGLILNLLIGTISVLLAAYIIPGVNVNSFVTAAVVAIVLGVLNTFLKPILTILTLPITILTLGLFSLVINTLMVLLAAQIIPGFSVDSVLIAFLFSVVVSLVNWFLSMLTD